MTKKIIAMAIAAAASGTAFGQSNVTIYGNVDAGFVHSSGGSGGATSQRMSGLASAASESYIGFKGAEDLGGGLKAVFDLQQVFELDTGASSNATENYGRSYIGLAGGFGTVVAGKLDGLRYGIYGKYNPFGNYSVGNFASMTTQYDRARNAVAYISPSFNGFTLILATSSNTQTQEGALNGVHVPVKPSRGNTGDDRLFSINLIYANGPLSVDLDYETTKAVHYSDSRLYVATTGASYDFGVVKLSGVYDVIKGEKNSLIGGNIDLGGFNLGGLAADQEYDRRNWFVGAEVPVNERTKLLASYGQVKDRTLSDADAKKWAIGARYALSKRTTLYADYAQIKNDDNAAFTITPKGNSLGLSGVGVKGFAMGMKHSF
ncbi:hypothetical protein C3497_07825 [Zoogloeaceae bacteirum Par-f-2]|nr:hypothetical protein C3497_07825 [Zoogloeaceae bacteirum Par-f-2]